MASSEIKTLNLGGNTYALNDTTARASLANKVDKVSGKGLSTNDYTTAEKTKLAGAVLSVAVNGSTYTPDSSGAVDLGTISGGSSGGATTPQELGIGYATCSTAQATTAKVATCSGYVLKNGGMVAVYFSNGVGSSATLNINSTGAITVRRNNSTDLTGLIQAGDTAFFFYFVNSSGNKYYQFLTVNVDVNTLLTTVTALRGLTATVNGETKTMNNYNLPLGTVTDFEIAGYDQYALEAPTVTFGSKHIYQILRYSNATSISLVLNTTNNSDNYVLIVNENTRDLVVTLRPLQYNGTATTKQVIPSSTITVPAGKALELTYIANSAYGIVTVGNELTVS